MVAIINGARVTPPKPDIEIPNLDPNSKLTVINNVQMVTEAKKSETSAQKKITVFVPDKLREFTNIRRLAQVRAKQRKGDVNEIVSKVRKKIASVKQQNLKGSRFAREIGKGSVFDILV